MKLVRKPRTIIDPSSVARAALGVIVLCAAAMSGCEHGSRRFLNLHMADDPKAQAKARWEAVRGSVKIQLAEEHLKSGRLDQAERSIEEALALSPNDPKAYVLATRLRLEQGRLSEAREAITVAAALNDNDPEIPFFAGLVAQRYGDLETACEHFAAASIGAPHVPDYVLARAEVLVNLDQPVEALELLQSRLNDFDQNVPMRVLAARICRILGLRGPAIAYGREAVRIGDDAPSLVAELGMLLVWAERYRDVVTVLSTLVEDRPSEVPGFAPSPSVVRALARAYVETGQGQKAIEVLRTLLQANPGDTFSWTLCARAAISLEQFDIAEEALAKIDAQGGATAESCAMAAYAALRRGDFTRVRREAARALTLNRSLSTAHYLAGQAAEAQGETTAAMASYEAVLQLDPGSTVAQQRIEAIRGAAEPRPSPTIDNETPDEFSVPDAMGAARPSEETIP